MPTTLPAPGEAQPTAADGDDVFAALLEAEVGGAETPAAPATVQTFSALSPALQAQALTSVGTDDGTVAGLIASAIASDTIDGAALVAPPAAATAAVTPLQSAVAAVVAVTQIDPATPDAAADTDLSEMSSEPAGKTAVTPAAAVPAPPASTNAALPPTTVAISGVSTDALPVTTQPVVAEPESSPETAGADTAEAAHTSSGSRSAVAQTPNQPASAVAAAQASAPAPADAVAAKADFAAMLASQSGQSAEPVTQATSQPSEAARTAPTPAALLAAPAATIQVYNRIIERADGRAQRFEIRLDPAELGRVDVRIEIGADRKVQAVLAAHDSAALSDLMRGQRALERALADAGIDLADNGVRFELARDNGSGSANQQRNNDGRPAPADVWRRFDTMTMPATAETAAAVQPSWRPQRLDLVA